jgi:hypothetical protein
VSKDFLPPTEAEEYRNTAEILRDLAEQVRFGDTRNELVSLADNFDRMAGLSELKSAEGSVGRETRSVWRNPASLRRAACSPLSSFRRAPIVAKSSVARGRSYFSRIESALERSPN